MNRNFSSWREAPSVESATSENWRTTGYNAFCLLLLFCLPALANAEAAWPEDDTSHVNEGRLHFLERPPGKPVHHLFNHISLNRQSLEDGWAELEQCHEQLDPVAESQVVYRYHEMAQLKVTGFSNIGKAWIEGQSVQLADIKPQAKLCISARVKILKRQSKHSFTLENGPFHRRFLDGYYPMQVTLKIDYQPGLLRLHKVIPPAQPGFSIQQDSAGVTIEALFEGKLKTRLDFERGQ